MRVLVCGGGVIGTSIAYFLSARGVSVTVIECGAIAGAASGKSGGFLALDWCDGTPLQGLARRSFALHGRLADELADDCGFRRFNTFAGYAGAAPSRASADDALAWLSPDVAVLRMLGGTDTTAQVHPALFTAAMMRAAQARGAQLRIGHVTGLLHDGDRVRGADVEGEAVEGEAVVIAMGPWSILAARWLPLSAVFGLKGHSLVLDTGSRVPAGALFAEYHEPDGEPLSAEFFPRPDGTTYVCAISSERPLPVDPANVVPDPGAIERLEAMCARMSPVLRDSRVLARQACYRPVTLDGLPLIGPVAGLAGAYVATGHSVWGILNAPATGEAMAELIVDGAARHVDLTRFHPGRQRPLDPARVMTSG